MMRAEDKINKPWRRGVNISGNIKDKDRIINSIREDNIYKLWDKPNLEDSKSSVLEHYFIS